ncbi:MAG: hypothetical protein CMQ46_01705 [Gammaproteobacteria bacterium]|nr:hypothetical protein [Gammaproteobacteria bacterium]MBJ53963.1 hypothetical protein [Gammaproteobacteria bacterium]HBN14091.1 hypothetical protein [Pseudohongiella sp.]
MILTDLYPYLILVGATILAVIGWLLLQANAQNALRRDLIKLNESVDFDLPDFLRQCWPVLHKGGFVGLQWRLDWFGTQLSQQLGSQGDTVIEQSFHNDDIALDIQLFAAKSGWERRYFSRSLAEHFFLLLRMDFWIKLGSVRSTFAQAAKLNVFLQHDFKNMLQLTSLASEQLQNVSQQHHERLLQVLRTTVPALRDRVELMLHRLQQDEGRLDNVPLSLALYFRESVHAHQLPADIDGDVQVSCKRVALQSIVDNLIGNYLDMASKQTDTGVKLDIHISQENGTATVSITDTLAKPCLWPERLFEPFWSEHGTGRGVGLYQSRQTAMTLGGDLKIEADANQPLRFLLRLPLGPV